MLSTKIKGGSGLSTNYVIRSTKNPKGGGGGTESKGGQKHPLAPPPEINPGYVVIVCSLGREEQRVTGFPPFPTMLS